MAAKKPSPANPKPSEQTSSAPHEAAQFRILKQAQCPTISGKSYLTYHLGCDPSKARYLRVTENSAAGVSPRSAFRCPAS